MNLTQMSAQLDLLDIAGSMLEKHDSQDLSAPGLLEVFYEFMLNILKKYA